MPAQWIEASLTQKNQLSSRVCQLSFALSEGQTFPFTAGQFVTMDLPIGDKRQQRWRSYSLANAPNESGHITFCIGQVPSGAASNWLCSREPGAVIRFKGPAGTFTYPESRPATVVMICTGTGVAPFRSMLLDLDRQGWPEQDTIHLIFGSRTIEDLLYAEEFLDLMQRRPNFRYTAALSRLTDPVTSSWIASGYVHKVYQQLYTDSTADILFMLCGWQNMIDEAVATLMMKMGYSRQHITYELYG